MDFEQNANSVYAMFIFLLKRYLGNNITFIWKEPWRKGEKKCATRVYVYVCLDAGDRRNEYIPRARNAMCIWQLIQNVLSMINGIYYLRCWRTGCP